MSFSIEKVAALAYLKLSDQEKKVFESQFPHILEYVNQLQAVPMTPEQGKSMGAFHVQNKFYEVLKLDTLNNLRDESQESSELKSLCLTNAEATAGAPRCSGLPGEALFEVPSIIERS